MANLDRNFLARPDFVVSTGENGQTITITTAPRKVNVGTFEEEAYNITGWTDINFSYLDTTLLMATMTIKGLSSVNPACTDNPSEYIVEEFGEEGAKYFAGLYNFYKFISNNPVHITKINLRTGNEAVLPQQIVIQHPNIFTGQCDQQIIDVASRKTAYQYQSGIITLDNLDVILSRGSNIKFNCSCNVSDGDHAQGVDTPENQLYIDITIDKYLSLEKALVENIALLDY